MERVDGLSDDDIKGILKLKNVAVVGLSQTVGRPSRNVAAFLLKKRYNILPVNPGAQRILGRKVYARLSDIKEIIDIVDIFRRPEDVFPIVEEAIGVKAKVVWMQEGIVNEEAARVARSAGLIVVMDRCMKKEYVRLFGE